MNTSSEQSSEPPSLSDFSRRLVSKLSTPEYIEGSKPAYTFVINQRQAKAIDKWIVEHNEDCRFADQKNCGSIGGRFTYQFINTYLGQICKLECACGAEVDVTDYDEW